ncbi:hypothetical protein FOL46_000783, partial [Perkinsus olseni]
MPYVSGSVCGSDSDASDTGQSMAKTLDQLEELVKYEPNKRSTREKGAVGVQLVSDIRMRLFELLEENRSLRIDLASSVPRSYRDVTAGGGGGIQPHPSTTTPTPTRIFTPNVKNKSVILKPTSDGVMANVDNELKKLKDALNGLEIIRIKVRQRGVEVITPPSTRLSEIQSKISSCGLPFTAGDAPKLQPEVLIFTGDYQDDPQNLSQDIKSHNSRLDPESWHTVRTNNKFTIYRMTPDQRKELILRGGCFVRGQKLKCKDIVTVRVCLTCGKAHANPANCRTKPEDRVCVKCCGNHSLKLGECPLEEFPAVLKCCLCGGEGHTPFRGDNSACAKTNELRQRKVNMTDYGDVQEPPARYHVSGYLCFRSSPAAKASVYVRQDLSSDFALSTSTSSDELALVVSSYLCVGSFYIPPGSREVSSLWQASSTLPQCDHTVLGGDGNGYHDLWGVLHPDRRNADAVRTGGQLVDFADSCLLECANATNPLKATYKHVGYADGTRESIVDVTFHGEGIEVAHWRVEDMETLSDHFAVRFDILLRGDVATDPNKTINDLSHLAYAKTDWNAYLEINELTRLLQEAASSATPSKKPPRRRKDKLWSLIEQKKRQSFQDFADKIENDRGFFKRIKSPARAGDALLLGDTTPAETVGRLADAYLGSTTPERAEVAAWPTLPTNGHNIIVTKLHVEKTLASRKKNWDKASGPDGLRLRHLSTVPSDITTELSLIITASIALGHVPTPWKTASVCFLPKGRSKGELKGVRPISLLPVMCKLCESCVLDLLQPLEDLMLSSDIPYGYLPGRSTTGLANHIKRQLHQGKKSPWALAALDCSNAFGEIKHGRIFESLTRHGVSPLLCNWIGGWLSGRINRALYLGIEECRFARSDVGTPQGAILSPMLFNICCFDALSQLQVNLTESAAETVTKVCSYADDSYLTFRFAKGLSTARMDSLVHEGIQRAQAALDPLGLVISLEKTAVLVNYRSDRYINKTIKVLGIIFSKSGSWRPHLQETLSKCQTSLNLILRYVRRNYGLSTEAMIKVFDLTVIPKLVYGMGCFGSILFEKGAQKTLNQFQAKFIKIALRLSHYAPTKDTLALVGRRPLSETLTIRIGIDCLHKHGFLGSLTCGATGALKKKGVYGMHLPTPFFFVHERAIKLATGKAPSPYRIYTDGSLLKHDRSAGAAFIALDRAGKPLAEKLYKLPRHASIAQCETYALYRALRFCKDSGWQQKATIFTDSYSCILSICSRTTRWLTGKIRDLIVACQCQIAWVPSHTGRIPGNELADNLANLARRIGKPVSVPFSRSHTVKTITAKVEGWREVDLGICKHPDNLRLLPPIARIILNRSRCLHAYRHRIGIDESPLCPACGLTDDGHHKLIVC